MTEGLEKFQNYIGGSFVDASDSRTFDSLDPYAGRPWASRLSASMIIAVVAGRSFREPGADDRIPAGGLHPAPRGSDR